MSFKAIICGALLIIFSSTCSYFFYLGFKAEYQLYQITRDFAALNNKDNYVDSKQRLSKLENLYNKLENLPMTMLTNQRSYRAKAAISGQLSELAIWNKQRRHYSTESVKSARQALSINPYNITNWFLAMDLEQGVAQDQTKNTWMLGNIQILGKWSKNYSYYASFYCLTSWRELPVSVQQQCRQTIMSNNQDKTYKAKLKGSVSKWPNAKLLLEVLTNHVD